MGQAVFHPDVFDRLLERFPDDARLFPPPEPGDAIAALFAQALELITRTGRSLRLATPEGRRCLGESAAAFYRLDNVDLLVRLRDLIDESPPGQFEQENEACLGFLRSGYRTLVRGQRGGCWEGLQQALACGAPGCALERDCHGDQADGPRPSARACDAYQAGWRGTLLALPASRRGEAAELLPLLLAACPSLGFLAGERELECALETRLADGGDGVPGKRTIMGLPVRLLSDLVERCLGELSARLQLPPERTYHLTA